MLDTIIIGAGPAGLTAAIYLLRANKKIKIFEKSGVGGQMSSSPLIENYPGFNKISGSELANNLYEQIEALGGEIDFEEVKEVTRDLKVITEYDTYQAKSIIIATGSKYRTLNLPNEDNLIGNGIHFCVSCDGAFYKDKVVAVIGGGNSAIINALSLSDICKKVYVVQNLECLTGEKQRIEQLNNKDNVEILYSSKVLNYLGDSTISGLEIESAGKRIKLDLDGIFLSIGLDPSSDIFKGLVDMNQYGYITDTNGETSVKGIFVAGDVRDKMLRQITIATADGTIAAINAINYMERDYEEK